jgi:hypothetical protein
MGYEWHCTTCDERVSVFSSASATVQAETRADRLKRAMDQVDVLRARAVAEMEGHRAAHAARGEDCVVVGPVPISPTLG